MQEDFEYDRAYFLETGYALEIDVRAMIYMCQFSIYYNNIVFDFCIFVRLLKFCNTSRLVASIMLGTCFCTPCLLLCK